MRPVITALFIAAVVLTAACSTSIDSIDNWASSKDGDAWIAKAVSDTGLDLPVRIHGLVTLVRMSELKSIS